MPRSCSRILLYFMLLVAAIIDICNANLTCRRNTDCPPNASCESGHVCFCNVGYIDHIDQNLRCLKEATKLGDICEKDIQCQGLLGLRSLCRRDKPDDANGKCFCNSESHYKELICHKNARIGDKCMVSSDCLISSTDVQAYCDHGKCICPPKHVASNDNKDCLPVSGLDEKCQANVTCIVPNSKCDGYCHCQMGFVPSKDNTRCLKAADSLNDQCEEDSQCEEFLKLSKCDVSTKNCTCLDFANRVDDQCWKPVELDGLCKFDAECYTSTDREGIECNQGLCSCKSGYTHRKSDNICIVINQAGFVPGSAANNNIVNFLLVLTHVIIILTF